MTIDPIYLAAFALTSCGAAFALGRFCRHGGSTGAWEGATSTRYEGMAPLGEPLIESRRVISEPGAAITVTQLTLTPEAKAALCVGNAFDNMRRDPSPHADGKGGGE